MSVDPGAAQNSAGVLITIGRVYEEVVQTRREITTLASSVTRALEQGADHEARMRQMEQQAAQSADHEVRLTAVERRVWMACGVATVISSGAAAWITELVTRH